MYFAQVERLPSVEAGTLQDGSHVDSKQGFLLLGQDPWHKSASRCCL